MPTFAATGTAAVSEPAGVAAPRDAATVVLLRDAPTGLQTWLLTRRPELAFAAGMSVFPGGRVDPADAAVPLARPGGAADVAARYDVEVDRAHALLVAAARETFEETGVLFARPDPDAVDPAVLDDLELDLARTALEARTLDFAAFLARHGVVVDGDAFVPWDRWITPAAEPRRYDTFFFVAALPDRALARDVTTESTTAAWVDVAAAGSGDAVLMPPTQVTLEGVGRRPDVAGVLAAAREAAEAGPIAATMPVLHLDADPRCVELPDGRRIALRRPVGS